MSRLLTLDRVSFAYDRRLVVNDLSFTLDEGDYLAVIGENGSGKTTLLLGLLGLKEPSSGVIGRGDALRFHRIGYLPQQVPEQRDFPATVQEIVMSGRLNRHRLISFYSGEDRKATGSVMRRLALEDLTKRSFRELSGGQRQRVLLARALVAAEGLLLLDEPVAGLDPVVSHDFYRLIRELNQGGVTVVMVSHDIHCVTRDSTHVLHLGYGHHFFGTTDEYMNSELVASYLPGRKGERRGGQA
ncbi:MAG TPA: metal ABC transporter ATP-binding protein [Bacillota bacterium]|jgi:zinc transport system ATP-binding protein|nr:metal ABC transporter ATP-binding protein [Fastidiosipila sp.]HPX93382.1 metal ABC transporter ATP-binding protein [Bacillota bacterium]HQB80480.1 metal ABC transporter ATP-binding protein [Bacillota bacterium]